MWGEFKVTDVKKETVSNMEITQVTSPNPDSHEHTIKSTRESYNTT